MTTPFLIPLDRVQAAYTAIDTIWADAEADNRSASVAEAELALQELATAVGLEPDPDEKDGEPLISLALAVARALRDALLAASEPGNPAAEYERLLRAAEQEAPRNPPAALALIQIADRWLSTDLASARETATS